MRARFWRRGAVVLITSTTAVVSIGGVPASAGQLAATTVTLTKTPMASVVDQEVTLTATVSPTDGGGTVTITALGQPLGCAELPLSATSNGFQATCQTHFLPYGHYPIEADYTGDPLYAASSGSLDQVVSAVPTEFEMRALTILRAATAGGPTPSATLETEFGDSIRGQVVRFAFADGTSICQATTNEAGIASCTGPASLDAELATNSTYNAVFDGSPGYLAGQGTGPVSTY